MKLLEILQDDIKIKNQPISRKPYDRMAKYKGRGVVKNKLRNHPNAILGDGVDAIVFHSSRPQNAGTVTKWIETQPYDAKDSTYIQYLIKNQNNPYVPKVYSISQYTTPEGFYNFSIQMEKLYCTVDQYIEKNSNDYNLMRLIVVQFFTDSDTDYIMNSYFKTPRIIQDLMKKVLQGHTLKYNVIPQLLSILNTIRNALSGPQRKATLDLHLGNVMIRLTSVGPQLVITDPYLEF